MKTYSGAKMLRESTIFVCYRKDLTRNHRRKQPLQSVCFGKSAAVLVKQKPYWEKVKKIQNFLILFFAKICRCPEQQNKDAVEYKSWWWWLSFAFSLHVRKVTASWKLVLIREQWIDKCLDVTCEVEKPSVKHSTNRIS